MIHLETTHRAISRSSQCSTTGLTKAVVCAILSGMVHIKEPLLLIGKSSPCGDSGFPLSLSNCGPLPYVQRHIALVCSALGYSVNENPPNSIQ